MGNKKQIKFLILILTLSVTTIFVHGSTDNREHEKPISLKSSLINAGNYVRVKESPLQEDIAKLLDLDDYVQNSYAYLNKTVDLYIGYYFSMAKISAAHDPLVCFPGQGWQVDNIKGGQYQTGNHLVNYNEMVAAIGEQQVYVLYWFQAHEKTASKVFVNKLNTLVNKLSGKKQEHAFVRISVPMDTIEIEEARKIATDFVDGFYPGFLFYINETSSS